MGFLPTCKEVHRLASEKLDRRLTPGEQARLQVHLFYCVACRNFDGQMQLIQRAMQRMTHADESIKENGSQ
jgi:predicted anti-sigma-YlaC factor YlaD